MSDLQSRIVALERWIRNIPARFAGGGKSGPVLIVIIGGQEIDTLSGIITYGIKRFSGTLTGIPTTTYDPGTVDPVTGAETVGPSPAIDLWPDGLGYGDKLEAGVYTRVIVCNDDRGLMVTALLGSTDAEAPNYTPSGFQIRMLTERQVTVLMDDALTTLSAYSPDIG